MCSSDLENLEFVNEILNAHAIKIKEEIKNVMEEKGSRNIVIENGDEEEVKNKESNFINEEDFKKIVFNLGDRLSYKTTYRIDIDEEKFLKEAIKRVDEYFFYRDLTEQYYTIEEGKHHIDKIMGAGYEDALVIKEKIEDIVIRIERSPFEVIDFIMEGTDLPRKSIEYIYNNINKKHLFNSQEYLDGALKEIKEALLKEISTSPIEYDLLEGYRISQTDIFKMDTVINTEIGRKDVYVYPKDPSDEKIGTKKGISRYYKFDSKGEEEFAIQLDNDDKVKLFTKLSKGGFVIDTPHGNYTPDWAIVYEEDGKDKLYFICETKFQKEEKDFNSVESFKIKCGKAHFKTICDKTGKDIKFSWANSYENFKNKNGLY